MEQKTVLFVDDDLNFFLYSIRREMMDEPYNCLFAGGASEALGMLKKHSVDTIVSDMCMPEADRLMFLQEVRATHPRPKQILVSGPDIVKPGYSVNSAATRTVTIEPYQGILMLAKPYELRKLQALIRGTLCTPSMARG